MRQIGFFSSRYTPKKDAFASISRVRQEKRVICAAVVAIILISQTSQTFLLTKINAA